MYTIDPGAFKHTIEIQELKKIKVNNIASEEWTTILKAKAKIINLSGKEVQEAQGINQITTKRFIIRYPRSLNIENEDSKKYRVFYKNKSYNITYSSNVQDLNKYLELVTERVS